MGQVVPLSLRVVLRDAAVRLQRLGLAGELAVVGLFQFR